MKNDLLIIFFFLIQCCDYSLEPPFLFQNFFFLSGNASLTHKAPITTAAGDINRYFFLVVFSEKIRLDVSSESFARQRVYMRLKALFSSKNNSKKKKKKKIKVSSAAIFVWRFMG